MEYSQTPAPASPTPLLPPSYQTQRPDQHGWNDPPTTVFGAQAGKKRVPRAAGLVPVSYLSGTQPLDGTRGQFSAAYGGNQTMQMNGQYQTLDYGGPTPPPTGTSYSPSPTTQFAPSPQPFNAVAAPPPFVPTPPPFVPTVTTTATPPPFQKATPAFQTATPPISGPTPPPPRTGSASTPTPAPESSEDTEAIISSIKKAVDDSRVNVNDNALRRILDDSERRLKQLFEKLGRNGLAVQVTSLLNDLSKSLTSRSKPDAIGQANAIMAAALAYSREGDDSGWSVGLKRLVVEVWSKVVQGE